MPRNPGRRLYKHMPHRPAGCATSTPSPFHLADSYPTLITCCTPHMRVIVHLSAHSVRHLMLVSEDDAERDPGCNTLRGLLSRPRHEVLVCKRHADSLTQSIGQTGTAADMAIQKTCIGTWVRHCLSDHAMASMVKGPASLSWAHVDPIFRHVPGSLAHHVVWHDRRPSARSTTSTIS